MYLFVYGTLRFPDSLIKQGSLMNGFVFAGRGKMKGVLYDIGNYPGAVRDNAGNEVFGELYRLSGREKVLDELDRYENYDRNDERHCEYIRRKTRITLENGEYRMAWVYWYNGNLHSKHRIEERDYMDYLKRKITGFGQE